MTRKEEYNDEICENMDNLKMLIQKYFEYEGFFNVFFIKFFILGNDLSHFASEIPDYKEILPFLYLENTEESQKIKVFLLLLQ